MKFGIRQITKAINDPIRSFQSVQILRQGAIFLASIILARSHLSLSEIGSFEWLVYLGFTFSFFWAAGFLQGLLTVTSEKDQVSRSSFIWSVFVLFILFCLALFLIFVFLSFYKPGDYPIHSKEYLLYGSWLFLSIPAMMVPYLMYLNGQTRLLHLFNVAYFIGYMLAFSIFWYGTFALDGLLILLNAFGLLQFTWLGFVLPKAHIHFLSWHHIFQVLRSVWPLVGYALMGGLALAFDGWLVHYLYGEGDDFAIYKYGSRELPLSLTLAAALSNAMIPILANGRARSMNILKIRSTRLLHLLFPLSIVLLIFSNGLFDFLYGVRFKEAVIIFDIMLLLVISRLLFPQTVLIALRENTYLFKVSLIEFVINVVGSIILVYYLGIPGIIIATVVAYGVEKAIIVFRLKQHFKITLNHFTNTYVWGIYSLILISTFLVKYFIL